MEFALLISLISLAFAAISIIFTFMRFGISITQEFAERPDVLERRDIIQQSLRRKLIEEWLELKLNYGGDSDIGEEELSAFFHFGQNAFICSLPTYLVNEISDSTQKMLSSFFYLIIGILGTSLGYYIFPFTVPYISSELKNVLVFVVFGLSVLIGYSSIVDMKNLIPKIIEIRRTFFRLTEDTLLEDAREVWDELREKGLI